jgi:hypothetical protein
MATAIIADRNLNRMRIFMIFDSPTASHSLRFAVAREEVGPDGLKREEVEEFPEQRLENRA